MRKNTFIASLMIMAVIGGSAFAMSACSDKAGKTTAKIDTASMTVEDWEKYFLDTYGLDKITEGLKADSIDRVYYGEGYVRVEYTVGDYENCLYTFVPDVEFSSVEEFDRYFSSETVNDGSYTNETPVNKSVEWNYIKTWERFTNSEDFVDGDKVHMPEISSDDSGYRKIFTYGPDREVLVDIRYDPETGELRVNNTSWGFTSLNSIDDI